MLPRRRPVMMTLILCLVSVLCLAVMLQGDGKLNAVAQVSILSVGLICMFSASKYIYARLSNLHNTINNNRCV